MTVPISLSQEAINRDVQVNSQSINNCSFNDLDLCIKAIIFQFLHRSKHKEEYSCADCLNFARVNVSTYDAFMFSIMNNPPMIRIRGIRVRRNDQQLWVRISSREVSLSNDVIVARNCVLSIENGRKVWRDLIDLYNTPHWIQRVSCVVGWEIDNTGKTTCIEIDPR